MQYIILLVFGAFSYLYKSLKGRTAELEKEREKFETLKKHVEHVDKAEKILKNHIEGGGKG